MNPKWAIWLYSLTAGLKPLMECILVFTGKNSSDFLPIFWWWFEQNHTWLKTPTPDTVVHYINLSKVPKHLNLKRTARKKGKRNIIHLYLNLSGCYILVSSSFQTQLFSWQKQWLHFEFHNNMPITCLLILCLFCPWMLSQQVWKDRKKVITIFTGFTFKFGPLRNRY